MPVPPRARKNPASTTKSIRPTAAIARQPMVPMGGAGKAERIIPAMAPQDAPLAVGAEIVRQLDEQGQFVDPEEEWNGRAWVACVAGIWVVVQWKTGATWET